MVLRRTGFLALGLMALGACSSNPAPEAEPAALAPADGADFAYDSKVEVGRLIAETRCSTCHAIGTEGDSTHPDAKPFR